MVNNHLSFVGFIVSGCVALNEIQCFWMVNWQAVVCLMALSWHFSGGAKENHENSQSTKTVGEILTMYLW